MLTTNWVKVSHWLQCLMEMFPSVLGSAMVSFRDQCRTFWEVYKYKEPNHVIFQSGKDLGTRVPIILYGDEGRGPKRAQYLDVSWETPFGVLDLDSDSWRNRCQCGCAQALRKVPRHAVPKGDLGPMNLPANIAETAATSQKGHSYLTKHLIFGIPSYLYKEHPSILDEHLRLLSEDMIDLFENGMQAGGSTWHGILVGVKGDMKWHAEIAGNFTRSYGNLGRKNRLMMCSLCHAGLPQFPFEEIDHVPAWSTTMGLTRPWEADAEPHFARIPFHGDQQQERMFQLDLFHLLKVGISRDISGSLIVLLCRLGFFDSDTDSRDFKERLGRAHGNFRLWCLTQKKSPGLRSFTPAFLNSKDFAKTPWTNSKGSDSSLLIRWLTFYVGMLLETEPQGLDQFLSIAKSVLTTVTEMHAIVESHGLYIPQACGQLLYVKLMTIVKGYHLLADFALSFKMLGFGVKPKIHGIKHVAWAIREEILRGAPYLINIGMSSCESNEDHVGKEGDAPEWTVRVEGGKILSTDPQYTLRLNGDGLDGAMRASAKKGFGFGVTGHVAPEGGYQAEGAGAWEGAQGCAHRFADWKGSKEVSPGVVLGADAKASAKKGAVEWQPVGVTAVAAMDKLLPKAKTQG
eukprot:Skav211348  [mRNA]  locus=scaffold1797:226822:247353:- [translate_table: standard]